MGGSGSELIAAHFIDDGGMVRFSPKEGTRSELGISVGDAYSWAQAAAVLPGLQNVDAYSGVHWVAITDGIRVDIWADPVGSRESGEVRVSAINVAEDGWNHCPEL